MTIKELIDKGLSQIEAVTYPLINSGMTYRELGGRLNVSHTTVNNWYDSGRNKLEGGLE